MEKKLLRSLKTTTPFVCPDTHASRQHISLNKLRKTVSL